MMNSAVTVKRYTPEELLAVPSSHRFELVDGQLVERNIGAESSWVAQQINRRLPKPHKAAGPPAVATRTGISMTSHNT